VPTIAIFVPSKAALPSFFDRQPPNPYQRPSGDASFTVTWPVTDYLFIGLV
jgi:hypothetical protein